MLCLSLVMRLAKRSERIPANWILFFCFSNLSFASLELFRLQPIRLKLVRRSWYLVLVPFPSYALPWIGDRSEEVTRGLSRRAVPTHALKVSTSSIGRSKVDLAALVKNNCF